MKRQCILFSLLFFFIHLPYCNAGAELICDKRFVLGLDLGVSETNQLGRAVSFPLGYSTFNYLPHRKTAYVARYGASLNRAFTLNPLDTLIIGLGYHQN